MLVWKRRFEGRNYIFNILSLHATFFSGQMVEVFCEDKIMGDEILQYHIMETIIIIIHNITINNNNNN